MEFADRMAEAVRRKHSIAILGVDPQLDTPSNPALPKGYTLSRFCCEVIEACEKSIVAIKPQFAFYEARGVDGMRALAEVIRFAKSKNLIVIGDAKRGDIGNTSAAYAEAILGGGDFGCDAVTVNAYQGSDSLAPFAARVRNGRGVFVLVKTSHPSSGEFQDFTDGDRKLWEVVASRVNGWSSDCIGRSGLSSVGAVLGATFPADARRARALMPHAMVLVPGYGTQGASAQDAVAAARDDGSGIVVNSSRALMYAFRSCNGSPAEAASKAAEAMRLELNAALQSR
jgi:orotidine-5'-phosphate decarboxylase